MLKFKKTDIFLLLFCIITIVFQVWMDLSLPDYMATVTKLIQTPNSDIREIGQNGIRMFGCAFLSMIAAVGTIYCSAKLSANIGWQLRRSIFRKVISFNNEEITKFSTASLITRTTHDVEHAQGILIMALQSMIKAPLMFICAITKISNQAWQWTAVTVGAVVIIVVVLGCAVAMAIPKFKIIQQLIDKTNKLIRENLNGLRVVRAYNAEKFQENKFETVNDELTSASMFAHRTMAIMAPLMTCIMSGISLIIYWTGAYLMDAAAMSDRLNIFSNMVVYSSYAMQVIMSFLMLTSLFVMLPRSLVHVKRIREVMKTTANMKNGKISSLNTIEKIEFKNVSFAYPDGDSNVIENISFDIKQGETVAIVGATASGKSSLAKLILRFYDTTSGQILFNGIDIKDLDMKVVRDKIGYISQKAILFSGDIEQNVAYGQKNINHDKLWNALVTAQAFDFVSKLDDKEHANVAQNGANFSGGQKQRISIARAIYKEPEILIFDDSFSALDYQTDKILRESLRERAKNATKIIVAQRIGTIKDADKIIVLENGQLVGCDKHKNLLENCEAYKEIALSQLSEEELYG